METSVVQFPMILTVESPLKIFWKQALQAILLAIGIALLVMTLLLFIPKEKKIENLNISTNSSVKRYNSDLPLNFSEDKLKKILQFTNMNYWRGNWAGDDLFAFMPTCNSDVRFITIIIIIHILYL